MSEYVRTVDDELDWSLLNQLHAVVLQMGTFCFRTKQVCLTVLVGVVGLITALTTNKLDTSIFVAGAVIPALFWFLDSIAYYYQVKLRGVMDGIRDRIKNRNSNNQLCGANAELIEKSRTISAPAKKVIDAFFNHSMWIYFLIILIDCILWAGFSKGVIA
ncbi:MAG: hypothetical protein ACJAR3_001993 [Roseivirga sp.]|jgi:hypothetical protein